MQINVGSFSNRATMLSEAGGISNPTLMSDKPFAFSFTRLG